MTEACTPEPQKRRPPGRRTEFQPPRQNGPGREHHRARQGADQSRAAQRAVDGGGLVVGEGPAELPGGEVGGELDGAVGGGEGSGPQRVLQPDELPGRRGGRGADGGAAGGRLGWRCCRHPVGKCQFVRANSGKHNFGGRYGGDSLCLSRVCLSRVCVVSVSCLSLTSANGQPVISK